MFIEKYINNKGITLVALVITIVVLIILAGVIISITLGNGGIIDKAKTAKEQYQNAESQEEIDIAKVTNEIDSYVDGNRDNISLNYSLDEQQIGTWISGKTLYKKSFRLDPIYLDNPYKWTGIPHGIQNVDEIWIDGTGTYIKSSENSASAEGVNYSLSATLMYANGSADTQIVLCVDKTNFCFFAGRVAKNYYITPTVTLLYTLNEND